VDGRCLDKASARALDHLSNPDNPKTIWLSWNLLPGCLRPPSVT
jgi:hypothetical protein